MSERMMKLPLMEAGSSLRPFTSSYSGELASISKLEPEAGFAPFASLTARARDILRRSTVKT